MLFGAKLVATVNGDVAGNQELLRVKIGGEFLEHSGQKDVVIGPAVFIFTASEEGRP